MKNEGRSTIWVNNCLEYYHELCLFKTFTFVFYSVINNAGIKQWYGYNVNKTS